MAILPWQRSWIEQAGEQSLAGEKGMSHFKNLSSSRRRVVICGAIVSGLLLLAIAASSFSSSSSYPSSNSSPPSSSVAPASSQSFLLSSNLFHPSTWLSSTQPIDPPPQNFHLLVPGNKPDANLCKAMLSSSILGYPTPVIINWNETFDVKGQVAGGSHLAKISGIYNWLASLDETHDEDLVLIIDGFDAWLQLRPQTVIDRYFDIIRRADQRIASEMGKAKQDYNIRTEVVFGCQKRCWPWSNKDPACYAVPESDLPTDIYGPNTDHIREGDTETQFNDYRQRFLNSGISMGTVRGMRKLFQLAMSRMQKESNFGSDQLILSHIYGDQEVWREVLRRRARSWWQRKAEAWGWSTNTAFKRFVGQSANHLVQVEKKAAAQPDGTYDFGIGIDFGSAIGINTVFAEDDTEWLRWNDLDALRAKKAAGQVFADISRVDTLADDIVRTPKPFWTLTQNEELPRDRAWGDVPLFTDVWTGIVPGVIHHNAHRGGRKALRMTWWNETWYANDLRALYTASVRNPGVAVAVSGYDSASLREWWPLDTRTGGGRSDIAPIDGDPASNWVAFEDVCVKYHAEVFRDDLGPWHFPAPPQ